MSEVKFKRPDGSEKLDIKFIRPSELAKNGTTGVLFEGTFQGTVPNPRDPDSEDYKFEAEDGGLIILNSAGNLSYRMKSVSVGQYCQVTYEGKKPIQKGKYAGTGAHSFDVLVAE